MRPANLSDGRPSNRIANWHVDLPIGYKLDTLVRLISVQ